MIIPGIKIGQKDWRDKIAIHPQFVEVWYRVDQADRYQPILESLQTMGIPFGLHFWGATSSGHEANLAYPGKIHEESIKLIQDCLQAAAAWQAMYVNIHSGNTRPIQLTLDPYFHMTPDETCPIVNDDTATSLRNQALEQLGRAAHECNTALLVELIPQATYNDGNRNVPVPEYPASVTGLHDLCKRNLIGFTNDFCHTLSMNIGSNRTELVATFEELTAQFLSHTHLCHANTVYPPFNGTDAHGGILPEDMDKPEVFPNQSEFTTLIQQHAHLNHDVYVVCEPTNNHVENYHALTKIIATATKTPV